MPRPARATLGMIHVSRPRRTTVSILAGLTVSVCNVAERSSLMHRLASFHSKQRFIETAFGVESAMSTQHDHLLMMQHCTIFCVLVFDLCSVPTMQYPNLRGL